jgi:curved DNA-binding protein CbpA
MARVPFDPATDYYQLLGVPPGASAEDIQAAYRRLAKEYHPDLNAGSAVAAARMARVNMAKSVLLDRDTRASYDQVRAIRRPYAHAVVVPHGATTTVRYAPYHSATRPRHRVVSNGVKRQSTRGFDRSTGIMLLVALPLIAALALYVFQAFQLSIEPLREAPLDASLPSSPVSRTTSRGAADAVFMMIRAQPPSRELATRVYNFSMARADSTPESELLRADARRLLRAAAAGDTEGWNTAVADICRLAGHCD